MLILLSLKSKCWQEDFFVIIANQIACSCYKLCWIIIKYHVSQAIFVLIFRVHNVYGWSVSDSNSQMTQIPTGSLYGCYDVRNR
jgi:hypothetical protein